MHQFESNDPVLDWFDRPEQTVYKDKLFMLPILSLCTLQDFAPITDSWIMKHLCMQSFWDLFDSSLYHVSNFQHFMPQQFPRDFRTRNQRPALKVS